MSRRYDNPPIVEALCEFHFVPSRPWDMAIPGMLYERIKGDFPKRRQHVGLRVGVRQEEDTVQQSLEMPQRMQFCRDDASALIQVGPDMLTVNHLKPYPTWGPFKSLVVENLGKYREIAEPKGLQQIGLRYINVIEFDTDNIELTDYFNYYAQIPADLPQAHGPFSVLVNFPHEPERDLLSLTFRSKRSEEFAGGGLVLDIAYGLAAGQSILLDEVADWIETAHARIEEAFEACITDECRALFA